MNIFLRSSPDSIVLFFDAGRLPARQHEYNNHYSTPEARGSAHMRNVRVFISSPGDLHEQRRMVAQDIEELNKRAGFRDRYKFVAYLYEQLAPAMTGDGPQDVVNEQMLRPSDADIVVCMLWSRIGTP